MRCMSSLRLNKPERHPAKPRRGGGRRKKAEGARPSPFRRHRPRRRCTPSLPRAAARSRPLQGTLSRWSAKYDTGPLTQLFGWNSEFHTGFMTPALRRLARAKVNQASKLIVAAGGRASLPTLALTSPKRKKAALAAKKSITIG